MHVPAQHLVVYYFMVFIKLKHQTKLVTMQRAHILYLIIIKLDISRNNRKSS